MGYQGGGADQGAQSVAIGYKAGHDSQAAEGIAIGREAAVLNQGLRAIALGYQAGYNAQTNYAVAIGYATGSASQGTDAIAIGGQSGRSSQGGSSVAIGNHAGSNAQGGFSVAIGYTAGRNSQPANSIMLNCIGADFNAPRGGFWVKGITNDGYSYPVGFKNNGEISYVTSDDRMKDLETPIKDALKAIMKLKPQHYEKRGGLASNTFAGHDEFGLMAQDVFYDVPEMRDLVVVPHQANPTLEKPPAPSGDIRDDPDYSAWGPQPATIMYDQLTPWLAKGIQEINNELPRTKTTVSNTWGQSITSLIVSANTNKYKTNAIPIVTLSNVYLDKSWHGVVSEQSTDTNEYDTLIDVNGETRIWVTDIGGSFESGDLVTTSNISPGYGQRQTDDIIRNYTVAKITQDCNFTTPEQRPIMRVSQQLEDVTYYIGYEGNEISQIDYEEVLNPKLVNLTTETVYRSSQEHPLSEEVELHYNTTTGVEIDNSIYNTLPEDERSKVVAYEVTTDIYNTLSVEDQSLFTEATKITYHAVVIHESRMPRELHPETEIRQELKNVLDENGQIVWEETGETEPVYTLVDHGVYKAALVSCKLI
jgi:hypothetical protein